MNDIAIYNFNEFPVRTQAINDNPYFCLVDVCSALGLSNPSKSKTQLNQKGVTKSYLGVETGKKADGTPARQQVELTFINEPNLYRLIFRSNKPQAQAFADWVYNEVLPAIRKTGSYSVSQVTDNSDMMKSLGGMVKKSTTSAVKTQLEKIKSELQEGVNSALFKNSLSVCLNNTLGNQTEFLKKDKLTPDEMVLIINRCYDSVLSSPYSLQQQVLLKLFKSIRAYMARIYTVAQESSALIYWNKDKKNKAETLNTINYYLTDLLHTVEL